MNQPDWALVDTAPDHYRRLCCIIYTIPLGAGIYGIPTDSRFSWGYQKKVTLSRRRMALLIRVKRMLADAANRQRAIGVGSADKTGSSPTIQPRPPLFPSTPFFLPSCYPVLAIGSQGID